MFDLFTYVYCILVLDSNAGQFVMRGQHKNLCALGGVHRGIVSKPVTKMVKALVFIDTFPWVPH